MFMKSKMMEELDGIKSTVLKDIDKLETIEELEKLRVEFLGKKGKLTSVLRGMGKLEAKDRPIMGQVANEIRDSLEEKINSSKKRIKEAVKEAKMKKR